MTDTIYDVAVIGAGLMGPGIAQIFAPAGYSVKLYDVESRALETAKERIACNFKVFIELGLAKPDDVTLCLDRITLCSSLEELCRRPQYLLEAIAEDIKVKKETYAELERMMPGATSDPWGGAAVPLKAATEVVVTPIWKSFAIGAARSVWMNWSSPACRVVCSFAIDWESSMTKRMSVFTCPANTCEASQLSSAFEGTLSHAAERTAIAAATARRAIRFAVMAASRSGSS